MEDSSQYSHNSNRACLPLPYHSRTSTYNDSLLPPPPPTSQSSLTLPYYTSSSVFRPLQSSFQLPSQPLITRDVSATVARPPLVSSNSYPSLKRPYRSALEELAHNDESRDTYEPLIEGESSKPTINADHRLLSFMRSPHSHNQPVVDQHGRTNTFEISAQLHGMFFLSEIATNAGDLIIVQPELTCYRRNLFQISGSVTGPSGPLSVQSERGIISQIVSQELTISATESVDHGDIRLIVIPWKTQPPNQPEPHATREQEPIAIPIFQGINNQDVDADLTVQNIAWRRLQFRVATANNGRRKELQQHFLVRLTLTATLSDGSNIVLTESTTAPIVVRGRSPRNFTSRKEIPLSKSSSTSQHSSHAASPRRISAPPPVVRRIKPGSLELPKRSFTYEADYPPSPLLSRHEYESWSSTQAGEHTIGTPTYPPPKNLLAGYGHVTSPGSDTPIVGSPSSYTASESSRTPFYGPTSTMPINLLYQSSSSSMDDNPRPSKSPRHAQSIESSTDYPGFEQRLSVTSNYNGDSNSHYLPPILPPERMWTPIERNSALHPASMPPPPLHHYAFPQENHPYVKREPSNTDSGNYTWRQ